MENIVELPADLSKRLADKVAEAGVEAMEDALQDMGLKYQGSEGEELTACISSLLVSRFYSLDMTPELLEQAKK